MDTPTAAVSWRDRLGTLLSHNRSLIALEVVFLILLMVLPVPGRTIWLLLAGWLSLWLRRRSWRNVGLSRPARWRHTLLAGIAIGAIYQLFSIGIVVPLLYRLTDTAPDLSQFASLRGNLANLLLWLTLSWSLAAFGEEMAYRGYVLNRLADLFGNSQLGWAVGLGASALFFGLGHIYQGIAGVLETFVFGAFLACLYLVTKRNLWLPIIVHGVNDTIGFGLIFFGLYPS